MKKIILFLLCSTTCSVNASSKPDIKARADQTLVGTISLSSSSSSSAASAAEIAAKAAQAQSSNFGSSSSSAVANQNAKRAEAKYNVSQATTSNTSLQSSPSASAAAIAAKSARQQSTRYLIPPANTRNEIRDQKLVGELLLTPEGDVYFYHYSDGIGVLNKNKTDEILSISRYTNATEYSRAAKVAAGLIHYEHVFIATLCANDAKYYRKKKANTKSAIDRLSLIVPFKTPLKISDRYWVYEKNGNNFLKPAWHWLYVPTIGYSNSHISFPRLKRSTSHSNLSNPIASSVAASSASSSVSGSSSSSSAPR